MRALSLPILLALGFVWIGPSPVFASSGDDFAYGPAYENWPQMDYGPAYRNWPQMDYGPAYENWPQMDYGPAYENWPQMDYGPAYRNWPGMNYGSCYPNCSRCFRPAYPTVPARANTNATYFRLAVPSK